jgi:hypothetical protein
VKFFSAEDPNNSYPADQKKNLGETHDVTPIRCLLHYSSMQVDVVKRAEMRVYQPR